jgi:diacylglycerol kinase family enzyme
VRVLLIVNAVASSVTARARVVIQKALAADHDLTVVETSRRGHAERLARGATHDGTEVVVALGGDGTLNEAANGLAGSDVSLAALPGGSTNVYARTIGISNDLLESSGQLLASLNRRSYRRVGLGCVNGRRFLFHVGVGFDAAVVAQVEKRNALKRYAGHPLFVVSAFNTWFKHYDHSKPTLSIESPEGTVSDVYWAVVSKTSPYTFLGSRPVVIAPDAGLDSALSLTAFRTLRFTPVIRATASALTSGKMLSRHPKILSQSNLEKIVLTGRGPVPYQVDGDHLGEVERLEITYEPDSLTIVVP